MSFSITLAIPSESGSVHDASLQGSFIELLKSHGIHPICPSELAVSVVEPLALPPSLGEGTRLLARTNSVRVVSFRDKYVKGCNRKRMQPDDDISKSSDDENMELVVKKRPVDLETIPLHEYDFDLTFARRVLGSPVAGSCPE